MNKLCVALLFSGALIFSSCQEKATTDDTGTNTVAPDSTTTGLEGTRDQSGTVGGTEVLVDTSSGQNTGGKAADTTKSGKANPRDTSSH